ncbi:MAG: hypothetical protein WDW38_001141 [Sanguina aurantia]
MHRCSAVCRQTLTPLNPRCHAQPHRLSSPSTHSRSFPTPARSVFPPQAGSLPSGPLPTPNQSLKPSGVPDEGENAILWAGYSSLVEKIRSLEASNQQQRQRTAALAQQLSAVVQQERGGSVSNVIYSAMFMMSFLSFINLIGLLATYQTHLFVPAAAKGSWLYGFVKCGIPSLVPLFNSAIVLLVCLQAVRVAWRALHW